MLTDPYADNWFDALQQRYWQLSPGHQLHLLVDGAFVPGLHRRIGADRKALLFDGLPGSGPSMLDVSPFVLPFDPQDRAITSMLRQCLGWPMVNVIETPEPWPELAARLAAWCIIEADGQRFNFRFADTRRLPAILKTLSPEQRGQFTGPAMSWSYIARDGSWCRLTLDGLGSVIATNPQLEDAQFAALVEDSRADEVLARVADHPDRSAYRPSQAHALICLALAPALVAGMGGGEVVDWCGWLLGHVKQDNAPNIAQWFAAWQAHALSRETADATEI